MMENVNVVSVDRWAGEMAFPVEYYALHGDTSLNFQMNRFYTWVGDPAMLGELRSVAPRINNYADLKREILALAEQVLAEGRTGAAAYYFRLAEFFIFADDPEKQPIRKRFLDLMRQVYPLEASRHFLIPYEAAQLSAYRVTPADPKGTVVLFGGFDSYIEEWFPMIVFLKDAGYDVVAFEGPGQGTVLEDFHLPLTDHWEKPVKAVLDYFHLDDVTLVGLSLGGCLAIRAAAYEPRVRRVVADDILTDFYEVTLRQTSPLVRSGMKLLLQLRAASAANWFASRAMRSSMVVEWGIKQGIHVMGVPTPYEFFKAINRLKTRDVSPLVTQDVLLMAGAADHYVPLHQFYDQVRLVSHARSLTACLFTAADSAQNHCHIGNIGLSLRAIVSWVEQCERRE